MTDTDTRRPATTSTPLRVLQASAALSVLTLLLQFVTAGRLLPAEPAESLVQIHAAGALVLHVVAFVAVAAAFWMYRKASAPVSLPVLAAVVLAAGFVQAYYGNRDTMWAHIPGAMVLTVGTVWLLIWSLRPTSRA